MDRRAPKAKSISRKVGVEEGIMQTDRKLINCDHKKVGRKGAALANTALRRESSCRLTVDKDREIRSGDAGPN